MKKYGVFLLMAGLLSATCSQAAPLATSDVFKIAVPEVKKIFADDREDTFTNDGLLREAIIDFIGVPDDPRELRDGSTMMTGCRPQSCGEKGAVIVSGPNHQLRAAAILHFHCHLTLLEDEKSDTPPGNQCDTEPTLEIFVIRRNRTPVALKQELAHVRELEAWGKGLGFKSEVTHVKETRLR
jgi:hypothetical protein